MEGRIHMRSTGRSQLGTTLLRLRLILGLTEMTPGRSHRCLSKCGSSHTTRRALRMRLLTAQQKARPVLLMPLSSPRSQHRRRRRRTMAWARDLGNRSHQEELH